MDGQGSDGFQPCHCPHCLVDTDPSSQVGASVGGLGTVSGCQGQCQGAWPVSWGHYIASQLFCMLEAGTEVRLFQGWGWRAPALAQALVWACPHSASQGLPCPGTAATESPFNVDLGGTRHLEGQMAPMFPAMAGFTWPRTLRSFSQWFG